MRDCLWSVHCARTILQKQFRKMSRMRQPLAIGIPGLPNWPSPLHNDASTLPPRPYRALVRALTPRPKSRIVPTYTHMPPPTIAEISRSAITIISLYDGWPAGRQLAPISSVQTAHVNFIHKNVRSTAGSTFNCIEITGEACFSSHRAKSRPNLMRASRYRQRSPTPKLYRAEPPARYSIYEREYKYKGEHENSDGTKFLYRISPNKEKMQMTNYIRLADIHENYRRRRNFTRPLLFFP